MKALALVCGVACAITLGAASAVHAADLASLQSFSVYEGMRLRGGVDVTVSRGEVICEDGHMSVDPGRGCFISRYPQLRRLPA